MILSNYLSFLHFLIDSFLIFSITENFPRSNLYNLIGKDSLKFGICINIRHIHFDDGSYVSRTTR
jgi:hypothetical protein